MGGNVSRVSTRNLDFDVSAEKFVNCHPMLPKSTSSSASSSETATPEFYGLGITIAA